MESHEKDPEQNAAMWQRLEEEQQAPARSTLHQLSGLLKPALERFATAWRGLPAEERRRLIHDLTRMAEHDFEMDFTVILRLALSDSEAEVRAGAIDGLREDDDIRLITQLTAILREDTTEIARVAAAQCLAHFVLLGELKKIRERSFDEVYHALLAAYRNPAETLEVRRRALESLGYTGRDAVPDTIAAGYRHPEEEMRISAVLAMGRSADPRWTTSVVQELQSPSPEMRSAAARACGELATREALQDLIDLTEDVDSEVQQAALWSLGQVGGDLARRTLESHLESESEALQATAQTALNELEFLHGNLEQFFGAPEDFSGESDVRWSEEWPNSSTEQRNADEDVD